jgi:hypothetical protein
VESLPEVGQAGALGEITANDVGRAVLFAERLERGAASIVTCLSFTRISIWRLPASSGCSSLVPVTSAARRAALAWSRSTPRAARARAAAVSGSLRAASSRWCEPTGCGPASRAASLRLVSAPGVVRSSADSPGSGASSGSPAPRRRSQRRLRSAPPGTVASKSSTAVRTEERSAECCFRTCAPTPSPSRSTPSRMCSVPM